MSEERRAVLEGIAAAQDRSIAAGRYGDFPGLNEDPARSLFGDNYDRLVATCSRVRGLSTRKPF
ncbi:hypothetical protein [Haloterrigena salinisoli]|uniref:hypothetical protein n=1 Tax=Haloterrigena salinisoli TaxID=3132747 RepID=UPI0030CADF6E